MRHIHPAKSFAQALAASRQPVEQNPFKQSTNQAEQLQTLLEAAKLYRQREEQWFDKIKRKEFAVNEKDRMMDARRRLDYLISTIKL